MDGLRLALSWLTILPVRVSTVDNAAARRAIALAPFVGLPLGGVAVGVLFAADAAGMPGLLAGLLTVALLAVLTRGMHLDGLADTADGLGCYGPPERALAVMRDGPAGPFAIVTLVIVIGAQAVSFGTLISSGRWAAAMLAVVAGRAAFVLCCTRGIPAARPDGLGALVAGSQPVGVATAWWLTLAAAAAFALPDRWWLGVSAVVLAATLTLALTLHTTRRLGGITGDILGAAAELTTTVILAMCTLAR